MSRVMSHSARSGECCSDPFIQKALYETCSSTRGMSDPFGLRKAVDGCR